MTLFELVKQNICVPDAAEHYGLQVNRNGMCSCPFHEERHPSMKLNERYFYCFGCGVTGDVIDLSSKASDVYIIRITDSEGQTRCYKLAI